MWATPNGQITEPNGFIIDRGRPPIDRFALCLLATFIIWRSILPRHRRHNSCLFFNRRRYADLGDARWDRPYDDKEPCLGHLQVRAQSV